MRRSPPLLLAAALLLSATGCAQAVLGVVLATEVRFSKVARYTSDFTPPTRLAADADTYLMLHFDEGTGATAGDTSAHAEDGTFGAGAEAPQRVVEEILQTP